MKNIKTFEGFFDFLKSKPTADSIDFLDIIECIQDIIDNNQIKCSFNTYIDGIFVGDSDISLKDDNMSFIFCDEPNIPRVRIYGDKFRLDFKASTDEEVLKEILLDIESKLAYYKCEMSIYLSWGKMEGRSWDKKYSAKSLIDSSQKNKLPRGSSLTNYNFTIKIVAPGEILPTGLKIIDDFCKVKKYSLK